MKRATRAIKAEWQYSQVPDAEARIEAAFDLIFSKSAEETRNLTENESARIMSHDESVAPSD